MSGKFKRMLRIFGLHPRDHPPRVFVSLNVFNAYRPSGLSQSRLSQSSTRVIVRVSIWTLLVLLLTFMIVYTVLLLYVDNTFLQKSPMRNQVRHRKLKLQGRLTTEQSDSKAWNVIQHRTDNNRGTVHRKVVWNLSNFYNNNTSLTQCKWQALFRILITSAPKSITHRQAIRDTWCKSDSFGEDTNSWHCVFLVGLTADKKLNAEIKQESEKYSDILIGNYFDVYENLTLKVIHGFNWSMHYCPSSFIIKTDEDCFVNVAQVHNFLLHNNVVTHSLYAGSILKEKRKLKVIRNKQQKWYVPYEDYLEEYYPPYATGMGYIVSRDVVGKIVRESAFIKPIVNEDAYMGIVIHSLGIEPISSNRFVLSPLGLSICNYVYLFVIHDVMPAKQKELLNYSYRARTECNHHSAITTWS